MRYIYLFIFSNCFILLRVVVNMDPILGTLGGRNTLWMGCLFITEYHAYIHTLIHSKGNLA